MQSDREIAEAVTSHLPVMEPQRRSPAPRRTAAWLRPAPPSLGERIRRDPAPYVVAAVAAAVAVASLLRGRRTE